MLKSIAATAIANAVRKRTGADLAAGSLATTLVGTGATMLASRGRRPLGIVLLGAGGYLMWREAARGRAAVTPPPPPRGAPGATASGA